MPEYEYECPVCHRTVSEMKNVKDRDESPLCDECVMNIRTRRIMSAGIFKINGFSEANGYSKSKGA